jgi:hypothetical protein
MSDDQLTNEINQMNALHMQNVQAALESIERAIRIGEWLVRRKAECGHGYWEPWVKQHMVFNVRTASRYMKVYRNRGQLKADTGLTEAYDMLADTGKPSDPKSDIVSDLHLQASPEPTPSHPLKMRTSEENEVIIQRAFNSFESTNISMDEAIKQLNDLTDQNGRERVM